VAALEPASKAPDFELRDLDDRERSLSEISDQDLLLLAFYHSACPTCRFAMPFVANMANLLQTPAVKIWGISQDPEDESASFARELDLKATVLIDEDPFRVSAAYGLTNVPTLFLISDGEIIKTCVGFSREDFDEIAAALAKKSARPVPDIYGANDIPALRPG